MPVTQRDIAQQLGISQYSVSHALRGSKRVSTRTRKRVRSLAEQLGYRLNASARATRRGRFGNIALLLSEELGRSVMPKELLGAIHDELAEMDMHLTLTKLSDEAVTDGRYVPRILREWAADGVLINYHKNIPPGMERLIEDCGHAAIWMNCKLDHDCVYPDDQDAGRRLTQHMIELGHRRIAYADLHCNFSTRPDPSEHYSQYDRYEGYRQAMAEAGLSPRRIDFADRGWKNKAALEFWSAPRGTWLDSEDRPSAVVTYSTAEAVPIVLAAQALGIRMPDALTFATFGEGPREMIYGLRIPSMQIPQEQVGRKAVEMLMNRIDRPRERQRPVRVPFILKENPMPSGGVEPSAGDVIS